MSDRRWQCTVWCRRRELAIGTPRTLSVKPVVSYQKYVNSSYTSKKSPWFSVNEVKSVDKLGSARPWNAGCHAITVAATIRMLPVRSLALHASMHVTVWLEIAVLYLKAARRNHGHATVKSVPRKDTVVSRKGQEVAADASGEEYCDDRKSQNDVLERTSTIREDEQDSN